MAVHCTFWRIWSIFSKSLNFCPQIVHNIPFLSSDVCRVCSAIPWCIPDIGKGSFLLFSLSVLLDSFNFIDVFKETTFCFQWISALFLYFNFTDFLFSLIFLLHFVLTCFHFTFYHFLRWELRLLTEMLSFRNMFTLLTLLFTSRSPSVPGEVYT